MESREKMSGLGVGDGGRDWGSGMGVTEPSEEQNEGQKDE